VQPRVSPQLWLPLRAATYVNFRLFGTRLDCLQCTCMYIHMYVYTYMCNVFEMHVYTCVCMCMFTFICMFTCAVCFPVLHTYMCNVFEMHMSTCICMCLFTCICMCPCARNAAVSSDQNTYPLVNLNRVCFCAAAALVRLC